MKRKHLGSSFEDFLAEAGILENCRVSANNFKIARALEKVMSDQKIARAEIARRHNATRTSVDRPLDPENT